MDYVFSITSLDTAALEAQTCQALRLRSERISRARHPRLWSWTDRRRGGRSPEELDRLQRRRSRVLSLCVLALGVVLLLSGVQGTLLLPTLAGIFGVAWGLISLLGSLRPRPDPFRQAAAALLRGMADLLPAQVTFTQEAMTVEANGARETTPYSQFQCVIDQPELLLLSFGQQSVLLLPKKALADQGEALLSLLEQRTAAS